jgi:hypothetical protein
MAVPTFDSEAFDLEAFEGVVGPTIYPVRILASVSRLINVRAEM